MNLIDQRERMLLEMRFEGSFGKRCHVRCPVTEKWKRTRSSDRFERESVGDAHVSRTKT